MDPENGDQDGPPGPPGPLESPVPQVEVTDSDVNEPTETELLTRTPNSYILAIKNDTSHHIGPITPLHYQNKPPRSPNVEIEVEEDVGFLQQVRDAKDQLALRTRRGCTRKLLYKRIPILQWLPTYSRSDALSDFVSGVTVGLTVLPQAIAFANVAAVPAQNGLYSSFVGCFVYTILGSARTGAVGPTAMLAILTRENAIGPDFAVLLAFYSGLVELLMGILQMGFIIDFISGPVTLGFTSATAILIGTTQVKDLLGIKISGGQFVATWRQVFDNIHNTRLWDAVLGSCCIAVLYFLRELQQVRIGPKNVNEKTRCQRIITNIFWLFSIARNILVVVTCGTVAYFLQCRGIEPFRLTGYVKPGLPPFQPPPFTTSLGNVTYDFAEMSSSLSSGTFVVAILAIVTNIATAKATTGGATIDATQEMLAIGITNILASFVGSMPITGALSRGAINNACGVKTTFGGIYTGIIVLVAIAYLTPYFFYIPKATLASVIIMAVIAMVEYQVVKPIWKTKKIDLIPAFLTFFSCLFIRLEVGLVLGIGVNTLYLLHNTARPKVEIEDATSISGYKYLLVTPDRSIVYPSVEYVKAAVSKAGVKQGASSVPVVVDSTYIKGIDFTAAKGVKMLMEEFSSRNQMIIFFNLKPSIMKSFNAMKPRDLKSCTTLEELDDVLKEHSTMPYGPLTPRPK